MTTPLQQEKNIQDTALYRRHVIEIITVLVALVVTFYAGYSLRHDHGVDDQTKTGSLSTPVSLSHSTPPYATGTPTDLINKAPAQAIPH